MKEPDAGSRSVKSSVCSTIVLSILKPILLVGAEKSLMFSLAPVRENGEVDWVSFLTKLPSTKKMPFCVVVSFAVPVTPFTIAASVSETP